MENNMQDNQPVAAETEQPTVKSETANEENNAPQQEASSQFDAKDIADNKMISALSYFGILFLIPLLARKDSKFAQEHAKQGAVVFICSLVLMFIDFIPFIGGLIGFFGWVALCVVDILALLRCVNGTFWEIPYIGKHRKEVHL